MAASWRSRRRPSAIRSRGTSSTHCSTSPPAASSSSRWPSATQPTLRVPERGRVRARLASANPHKLVELRRALPGWEIELVDDTDFPPETGSTYEENARGKALHGRRNAPVDAWVIGEDSGIEASGLGGRPGLASARWAIDGVAQLLVELAPLEDRRARYVCVIVAIGPASEEVVAEGTLAGTIAPERRGTEG